MAAQDAQPFHWHYPELDDKNFQLQGRSLLLLLLIIFSVILFFTLLCLYMRWVCRCPARWGASPAGLGAQPPSSNASHRPLGLDTGAISSLPVLLHRAAAAPGDEEAQCSICLSVLTEGEKVKVLPSCSHTFHPECVDEWLRTRSNCPLCRASLGGTPRAEPEEAVV